jgi:hypothetical protein
MRVSPHANLTITLIRRNQFGSLRFRGCAPGYPPCPTPQSLATRLRGMSRCWPTYCPPPQRCPDARVELWRPVAWPHVDAIALPPVQTQSVMPPWPDPITAMPPIQPRPPQQRGSLVDVLA